MKASWTRAEMLCLPVLEERIITHFRYAKAKYGVLMCLIEHKNTLSRKKAFFVSASFCVRASCPCSFWEVDHDFAAFSCRHQRVGVGGLRERKTVRNRLVWKDLPIG